MRIGTTTTAPLMHYSMRGCKSAKELLHAVHSDRDARGLANDSPEADISVNVYTRNDGQTCTTWWRPNLPSGGTRSVAFIRKTRPRRSVALQNRALPGTSIARRGSCGYDMLQRHGWRNFDQQTEPAYSRDESVPATARVQSRGLVSVGRRGVCEGAQGEQADLFVDRLFDLSLVPRHGARVVREQ